MLPVPLKSVNPMSGFMPSLGGDSGPALSTVGDTTISQGGLNVPYYPFNTSQAPLDRDMQSVFDFAGFSGSAVDDDSIYYYLAAGFIVLLALRKRWK